jgi:hypothetical protein
VPFRRRLLLVVVAIILVGASDAVLAWINPGGWEVGGGGDAGLVFVWVSQAWTWLSIFVIAGLLLLIVLDPQVRRRGADLWDHFSRNPRARQ